MSWRGAGSHEPMRVGGVGGRRSPSPGPRQMMRASTRSPSPSPGKDTPVAAQEDDVPVRSRTLCCFRVGVCCLGRQRGVVGRVTWTQCAGIVCACVCVVCLCFFFCVCLCVSVSVCLCVYMFAASAWPPKSFLLLTGCCGGCSFSPAVSHRFSHPKTLFSRRRLRRRSP